jgi:hypothetical protein
MKVGRKTITVGALALLGFGTVALAQRPGVGWGFNPRGPMLHKVVTNEPYSGVGVTSSTQTLSNGTTINRAECVKLYRDSQGRTRREVTLQSSTCSTTPQSIAINDPLAGVEYFINPQSSTYRQVKFNPPASGTTTTSGTRPANPNSVQTSLGTELISGTSLMAQGTQTVTTIPAGQRGNSQAITITSIRWYSPDLQILVQSSRTDPRTGATTYQLSNVSTAEPAESLFQLPSGLTQQQGPAGHARRGN